MSDQDQKVISEYFSPSFVSNYFILSAAVLVLYDYFLTLGPEMSHIWRGRFNVMKALFVLNRYIGLISTFSVFFNFSKPASDTKCQIFFYVEQVSDALAAFAICSIFTLRTFAIYGRKWSIFLVLAIPALILLAADIWMTIAQTALAFPQRLQIGPNTCYVPASSFGFTSSLISVVSSNTFDALVVILTINRTAQLIARSNLRKAGLGRSLVFILLRDGIFYYGAIFFPSFVVVALDAIDITMNSNNISLISDDIALMVNALQIVIVNRLVIDLSQMASTQISLGDSELRSRSGIYTTVFSSNSIFGNIGGPVRSVPNEPCGDE